MKSIYQQQVDEITEYHIYKELAKLSKNEHNKEILEEIAKQELSHYKYWKKITQKDAKPEQIRIKKYIWLARIFGLSFALRLMETGEKDAGRFYAGLREKYPDIEKIEREEIEHEQKLISLLNDQLLNYAGAIVLGLNDALVELTGTLAGLTFAFNNNGIVGITGLIMGLAASLSMAASGYLSSQEEEDINENINPTTAAIYTGLSYVFTVVVLVLPYFLVDNPYVALVSMLLFTILIIAGYTYYISVAKQVSFKKRFIQMTSISLGVALISYGIGQLVKHVFGIDI